MLVMASAMGGQLGGKVASTQTWLKLSSAMGVWTTLRYQILGPASAEQVLRSMDLRSRYFKRQFARVSTVDGQGSRHARLEVSKAGCNGPSRSSFLAVEASKSGTSAHGTATTIDGFAIGLPEEVGIVRMSFQRPALEASTRKAYSMVLGSRRPASTLRVACCTAERRLRLKPIKPPSTGKTALDNLLNSCHLLAQYQTHFYLLGGCNHEVDDSCSRPSLVLICCTSLRPFIFREYALPPLCSGSSI